ncbi:uncharacterized protein N7479_009357 [Penicillium vulpinum]|uniref:Transcription factor domain-containing protein n=1 Tax=Penicillium vulpinum TaxID=29845 RepID=A0A1V6RV24_9EURO|nr:uncharacterized protein N7479_009357 [Penicillium vulpinum]KAJ5950944.1 hypothetical protein N7479_009357 [Penicillium vulpinum]OQE05339.1 hypothetical protein PENVUL_c025G09266 [Penicillium vulpinum]
MECPGYGLQLKWVQGVASRGSLRGRAFPSLDAPITVSHSPHPSSDSLIDTHTTGSDINALDRYSHSTTRFLPSKHVPSPVSEFCLSQARPLHVSRLLSWFNDRVAHRLAWVPQQNAWRQMILPMAESSETVLSSILAIAAHDLASEYPPNDLGHGTFQQMSKSYQNKSLVLLAQELNNLSTSSTSALEASTTSAYTLASVILLCNNEFMKPQGAGWRVHLSAAREIILAAGNRSSRHHELASIEEFLMLEFYEASVWADLTTFENYSMTAKAPPISAKNAVFTDFIRVIDQITRLERLRFFCGSIDQDSLYGPMQDIHSQIESARSSMMRLSGSIHFSSEADQHGFELVVWMYYHATLIYSHQALSEDATDSDHVRKSRDEILRYVQFLSETRDGMFAQDLVWPLFMAGTELRGYPTGQRIIQECFGNVMRISRTLDRARVLSFVETWWNEPETHSSWIDMARKQSQSSQCDILIV